ncbi:YARHG domain-containing protein [Hansschlegelia plantiphila]|uniref:YARHG domain-containing protein n=1 Tax=Hansschlegelia plantiphila TaxID=374655 RepID=UPI0022F2495F|nr:YARHG domain-containing protein [Hansschlegelia plantiphila]
MRLRLATSCALALLASPAVSQSICADLWRERNSIYRNAGYCFKTPRAIRAFGSAGCSYDDIADVPLSARERADIMDITREEHVRGCPR